MTETGELTEEDGASQQVHQPPPPLASNFVAPPPSVTSGPASLPPMAGGNEQHSGAAPGPQLVSVGQMGNLRTETHMSPASGPHQPRPPMASSHKAPEPTLPPIQQKLVQAHDGGQNTETGTHRFQLRKSTRQLTGINAVLASIVPSGASTRGRSKPEQSQLSGQETVDQTNVRNKIKYD